MSEIILYKYRDWSKENHKRILTHRELFFSSVKSFNDPFDGRLIYRYDLLSDEERYEKYYEHLKRDKPYITKKELRKEADEWVEKRIFDDPDYPRFQQEYQHHYVCEHFGVVSLSTKYDDILMWSHYANSHTGYVVGFNKEKLINFCKIALKKQKILFDCYEVKYSDTFPQLHPLKSNTEEYVITPLITKNALWKYENEYRLIQTNGTDSIMTLDYDIYEQIIFGCNILDKDRNEIIRIIKENFPDISIYQLFIDDNQYKLNCKKVNV